MKLALLFITFLLGISFNSLADDTGSVAKDKTQAGVPCLTNCPTPSSTKPNVAENKAKLALCSPGKLNAMTPEESAKFHREECDNQNATSQSSTPSEEAGK